MNPVTNLPGLKGGGDPKRVNIEYKNILLTARKNNLMKLFFAEGL